MAAVDVIDVIDQRRTALGWSRATMAQRCGLSETTVYSLYSRRSANLRAATLRKLASGLHLPLSQLLGEADATQPTSIAEAMLLDLYRQLSPAAQREVMATARVQLHIDQRTTSGQGSGALSVSGWN